MAQGPYDFQSPYGWGPGWSGSAPIMNHTYANALGSANQGQAAWQALMDSGLFDSLSGGGQDFQGKLQGDPAYQKLLELGQQSFGSWYQPIAGQVSNLYGAPMAAAKSLFESDNPSGMPVGSASNYYAGSSAPIMAAMQGLRQNLEQAGRAGGNRSGLGSLASMAPGVAFAGQLGQAQQQASAQATQDEQQRAGLNTQTKLAALGQWSGLSGQQAAGLQNSLATYGAQQNAALQAAMQALFQMLGLQVQAGPQWQAGWSPTGGLQFGVSGTGGL